MYTIWMLDASGNLQHERIMRTGETLGHVMATTLESWDMHIRDGAQDGPEVSPYAVAASFDRRVGSWELFSNDDDDYPMGVLVVQEHASTR